MPNRESFSDYAKQFERPTQTPRITLEGNHQVTVEGYQRILQYDADCLVLALKSVAIQICGVDLVIEQFTKDVLVVKGNFTGVEYRGLEEQS